MLLFCRLQDVPFVGELMNLDTVSLLKKNPLMKSITWEISPETILMQEDFLDSNMASNTINSGDNGGTTLEINSIEIKVDHPHGHKNKGLVSMIAQRSWKRLVATYPSAGGRRVTHGCMFQERNTRGVATNVYLRKTLEKSKRESTNFKQERFGSYFYARGRY